MKKVIVLISGNGSNLNSIINSSKNGYIKSKVVAVFSNNSSAYGLIYARKANIPYHILKQSNFVNRESFDKQLASEIDLYNPDLIVLAGYMFILSSFFVKKYYGRIINIHPSLLPKYPGLYTHRQVLKNGDREHGSTVHFVNEKIDDGPIILQIKIKVFKTDNELNIMKRLQKQENRFYPLVIKWFVDERIKICKNQVLVDGKLSPIIYQC